MQTDALKLLWQNHDWRFNRKEAGLVLVAGLLLAFLAPYQSGEGAPFWGRFLYWSGVILFASLISGPIAQALFPRMIAAGLGPLKGFFLYTTVLALPIFALVFLLDVLMKGLVSQGTDLNWSYVSQYLDAQDLTVLSFLLFFLQVWLIAALINGFSALLFERFFSPEELPGTAPAEFKFLNRLPAKLGQDLVCLSMEEHYVRVHTAQGNTLVRMRMGDAVTELAGYEGARVHRSWWIAFSAIERVNKQGRRHIAHLKTGIEAPVSTSYLAELKARGYL